MATFVVGNTGLDVYSDTLRTTEAVKAAGELLGQYTKEAGSAYGIHETVDALRVTAGGSTAILTYEGNHSGNPRRNGEVAFVNEYGARGRTPRPFNRSAFDQHEEDILQEIEDRLFGE